MTLLCVKLNHQTRLGLLHRFADYVRLSVGDRVLHHVRAQYFMKVQSAFRKWL
jgi:hypothetical protein